MNKKCKKCGKELDGNYSNEGDCLCDVCGKVVTYYRFVD